MPTSSFTGVSLRGLSRAYSTGGGRSSGRSLADLRRQSRFPPEAPGASVDREGDDGAEERQGQRHHREDGREATIKETERDPAAAGRDDEPAQPREQRPEQTSGALRREVEGEPESEEAVCRPDDTQVGGAGAQ